MENNLSKKVEQLLEYDVDTLFSFVGLKVAESESLRNFLLENVHRSKLLNYEGEISFSPGTEEEVGKKYFLAIKQKIETSICKDWDYCKKINDAKFQDRSNLIITISDIVASITIGIPPAAVTALILKIGLDKICNCEK
jgi:hypothetical protein